MAFDGVTAAAVVDELNNRLLGGSIAKVAQPERDELLLSVKVKRELVRLTISASASTPMVYLRDDNAASPVTAPNFCMSLRKHIGGGRIKRIFQPSSHIAEDKAQGMPSFSQGLERIIIFEIEHLDEMGDTGIRYLISEIMGKHSNIILTRQDLTIIDSIKHVSHMTSSVREVLPGRTYFIPDSANKANPFGLLGDKALFSRTISGAPVLPVYKKLYMSVTGLSPAMAEEIVYRAGLNADVMNTELGSGMDTLYNAFSGLMGDIKGSRFEPCIIYDGKNISEFAAVRFESLDGGSMHAEYFGSMSEVIRLYYEKKDRQNRIRAKSEDIRHVLKTLTERAAKKLDLLERQYRDTEGREKYRIWGELINTYGYGLKGGEDSLVCENYYDAGNKIRIPLDKNLSAKDNAARYFERYQKLKRTREAVAGQIDECRKLLYHLESITGSLRLCETEADLEELRREMAESGYINRTSGHGNARQKKAEQKSKPLHFVSSDGVDIYVGRNNFQNEELDFKLADANDWWFHAKNIPGSHVIAKTGNTELPDATCLEAAALAAYYCKACMENGRHDKIEVDYVKKKELRRVPQAAPGFVIYHTNYSVMVEPRESL